jgi:hypothetical protein
LNFRYPSLKSPDTHSSPAVQLPIWTLPWQTQLSCSSVTQLKNLWHT